MKKIALLAAALAFLILSLLDFDDDNMNNINDYLKTQIDLSKTPSIQYAYFDVNNVIYEFRDGLKNVKEKQSLERSTTYNLFSVTKTFTALAVFQLVQQGRLKLSDQVSVHLPDFPYDNSITIEHLLSHTSGISNPLPLRWIHAEEQHDYFEQYSFFSEVFSRNARLDFTPGSKYKYSNLGYVFLGRVIESVSGQKLDDYIHRSIIEPCDIDKTALGFHINPPEHATGYHKWWSASNVLLSFLIDKSEFMGPREGKWKPFKPFYINGKAYGGMIGSGPALVRYAQTLLKDNSPLINNEYKRILFTEKLVNDKPTGMSNSWFTGMLKGNRYFAHAGGGGGYYVELRVYPDLAMGSVILYNRSGMTDERILDKTDSFFIREKP